VSKALRARARKQGAKAEPVDLMIECCRRLGYHAGMMSLLGLLRCAPPMLLAALLTGCLGSGQSPLEEENEPHFLTAKSRASAMDYKGAVEEYEKAVEVNPHSGSAHFELGLLYEQRVSDPAAAIYHYNQYLQLRPTASNVDRVKERIVGCKQELARTVSLGPPTQALQRELEQMVAENKQLREEVQKLNAALAARLSAPSNPPEAVVPPRPNPQTIVQNPPVPVAHTNAQPTPSRSVTYTVRAGDTPAAVAKRYGVRVDALLAANPRLDPRRLRVGQTLTIPAR
jgi:LysM repeat protein